MGIIGVFDNPRFMDRYTVVLDERSPRVPGADGEHYYIMLSMSNSPHLPNGISILVEGRFFPSGDNSHLGESISFDALPEDIQAHVRERLEDWKTLTRGGLHGTV